MSLLAKIRVYVLIFLCFIFGISLVRNIVKVNQAKRRVVEEQIKLKNLADQSKILNDELKKMQTNEYLEKEIRDKLGLSKENEAVVILPDTDTLKKLVPEIPEEEDTLPPPIWKKWANLFSINI